MPEQRSSILLTQDENDTIFGLLGYKCQTMATTVVELYTTGGPSGGEWHHKETGVLCFVKDSAKRSYFFRVYCPVKRKLLWEHEVYNNFEYLTPTPFLHSFEAENCIAAFNFASEEEGKRVRDVLSETLESKKQRRVEKRNRGYSNSMSKRTPEINGMNFNVNVNPVIQQSVVKHQSKKDGKRKYTKADIGQPQDFRHLSHIGWDPNRGFDFEKGVDPQLQQFFNQAGVSDTHLRDKETRDFIYDFINKNGGIEKVKAEMEPPPIPIRARTAPPRPPVRPGPPPLPPPPPRTQPPRTHPSTPKQEVNTSEIAYPPPPPPPPPPPGPPPPPVMNMPLPSLPPDPRAALMDELTKNKAQLKPLNVDSDSEDRRPPPPTVSDSRGQLMDQIKVGVKLKPVTPTQNNNLAPGLSSGLASALAKALAERNKVIHSDSSSTSDTDEPDDEWDE